MTDYSLQGRARRAAFTDIEETCPTVDRASECAVEAIRETAGDMIEHAMKDWRDEIATIAETELDRMVVKIKENVTGEFRVCLVDAHEKRIIAEEERDEARSERDAFQMQCDRAEIAANDMNVEHAALEAECGRLRAELKAHQSAGGLLQWLSPSFP